MATDWEILTLAFLSTPLDRAWRPAGQLQRACRYGAAALGRQVSPEELQEKVLARVDQWIERLPVPESVARPGPERAGSHVRLIARHPFSAQPIELSASGLDEQTIERTVSELAGRYDQPQQRFLALWRLLPERLASLEPAFRYVPADPAVADHTVWHHADVPAGLCAAARGPAGAAIVLLAFAPVQPFIEAARSVHDLWAGNLILSWLAFRAMLPLLEPFGPTAVLFPHLRGNAWLDQWLRGRGLADVPEPSATVAACPCLPNRFMAVVPLDRPLASGSEAGASGVSVAELCIASAKRAWSELAETVRRQLEEQIAVGALPAAADWDRLWDQQIEDYFEFRSVTLPLRECSDGRLAELLGGHRAIEELYPEVFDLRRLASLCGRSAGGDGSALGRWQLLTALAAKLFESARSVRHVPAATPADRPVPAKCSLFGSIEQMGRARLADSAAFWRRFAERVRLGGQRVGPGERLSAVALTKRFAVPVKLAEELGLTAGRWRFPDTATVAAADWLRRAVEAGYRLDPEECAASAGCWNGQGLHWPRPDFDRTEQAVPEPVWSELQRARRSRLGPAPTYYAVLRLDGDRIGEWLAGCNAPRTRDLLSPAALEAFNQLGATATDRNAGTAIQAALDRRWPMSPARHVAVAEALANFALHVVPQVVAANRGLLIYAGGDDVLALLPCRTALACALQLRRGFASDPTGQDCSGPGFWRAGSADLAMPGPGASVSAGIAVVHYRFELRAALRAARQAERSANRAGRDLLQLAICGRSAQQTAVYCPWDFVDRLSRWLDAFAAGASDRWAYVFAAELPALAALPQRAVEAELARLVSRSHELTRSALAGPAGREAAAELAGALRDYLEQLDPARRGLPRTEAIEQFCLLVQAAAFLAWAERQRATSDRKFSWVPNERLSSSRSMCCSSATAGRFSRRRYGGASCPCRRRWLARFAPTCLTAPAATGRSWLRQLVGAARSWRQSRPPVARGPNGSPQYVFAARGLLG